MGRNRMVFASFFVFAFFFALSSVAISQVLLMSSCPDYCRAGFLYYNGTIVSRAGDCSYIRRACDYGCAAGGISCDTASAAEVSCRDYCSNGVSYRNGAYNRTVSGCMYSRTACDYGCDGQGFSCAPAPANQNATPQANQENTTSPSTQTRNVSNQSGNGATTGAGQTSVNIPQPAQNVSCIDTDGGFAPNTKGIVEETGLNASFRRQYSDECISPSELSEGLCNAGRINRTARVCEYGFCEDGACRMPSQNVLNISSRIPRPETSINAIPLSEGAVFEVKNDRLFIVKNKSEYEISQDFDYLIQACRLEASKTQSISLSIKDNNPVYEVRAARKVKLLWLFDVELDVSLTVNATDLKVIERKLPWWSFLTQDSCGDGSCDKGETDACMKDCGSFCGNGVCDTTDSAVCPWECPEKCGDGLCQHSSLYEECLSEKWAEYPQCSYSELDICPHDCSPGACGNQKCEYMEDTGKCPDCSWCGDGICSNYEFYSGLCVKDCGLACGDMKCVGIEQKGKNCILDCSWCGDKYCGWIENSSSCPIDCPSACGNNECTQLEAQSDSPCPVDCDAPCGNNICEGGETPSSCPVDCLKVAADKENWAGIVCGNGICQENETPSSCPNDCMDGSCGNSICDINESIAGCPSDCKAKCGNKVCDSGETVTNCKADCIDWCGDGFCTFEDYNIKLHNSYCTFDCKQSCGDGICSATEDYFDCQKDCNWYAKCGDGACANGETAESCAYDCAKGGCGDGVCSAYESVSSCPPDCTPTCGDNICSIGEGQSCAPDCYVNCGDGICFGAETKSMCPDDCNTVHAKKIKYTNTSGVYCGDGICKSGEDTQACPADCKAACGDGACASGENLQNCKLDCSQSCGNGECEKWESDKLCPLDCGLCGDGTCSQKEEAWNCSVDCFAWACGNGECSVDENVESCPEDCDPNTTTGNVLCGQASGGEYSTWNCGLCGDGICAPSEKEDCAFDCSAACGNSKCEAAETAGLCPFDCIGQ